MTHTPIASIEALLAGSEKRTLGQLNTLTDDIEALAATGRREALCALRVIGSKLLAIPPARGANQNIRDGAVPKVVTRKSAAEGAGLSERKCKTALRIAKVPYDKFVALVAAEDPPTIEAMAALGTTKGAQDSESSAEPEESLEAQLERIRKEREKRFNALAIALRRQYLDLYDQWMAGSMKPEAMLKTIAQRAPRQRRRAPRAA